MKVAVIGSNGLLSNYIGKYCNLESHDLNVYGRTEPNAHSFSCFHKIDLLQQDLKYNQLLDSDLVIYAAGAGVQSSLGESAESVYKLNTCVPLSLFNNLKNLNFKGILVTFGSYFEVGENSKNIVFNESDVIQSLSIPPNDYSISKRMLTRFFNGAKSQFNFYHFILPTIYSETESEARLIPYTLKAILENRDLQFTSGDQVRQYIHTKDVVKLIFIAIEQNLLSGIYNISGTEEYSVKDLVKLLFDLNNRALPDSFFGQTKRLDEGMKSLRLDDSKLMDKVNDFPRIKIQDVYDQYSFK
jgi:nucleoside-diphosphate-sugar epimerase